MSLPAFYLSPDAWDKNCFLVGEEAKHAQVLRLKTDEKIIVLDGKGRSAICEIKTIGKRDIELAMLRQWSTPKPNARAIVALALSKAARRGFFLEKAAELSAWEIWLWEAERSQGAISDKLIDSCERQLCAGAKQCHNPWFPAMRAFKSINAMAESAKDSKWRLLPWEAESENQIVPEVELGLPGDTIFVIGPEGGLTEKEVDALRHFGFVTISLGKRVLRCETAATLCLGLHYWAARQPGKPDYLEAGKE